ncbi:hypothetical protein SAMN06265371_108209 [Lutibacter agarilyticus]|uniref:Gliding motility-associated lipoprotein GldH n=1 Tax=Lutibacter agarilyticus TaxID=1109740 RepID=A0A238YB86_9FLAO|nr:hypothetical protein [Lutibacter agarilyticus]SNR68536.1 hypothetical protein SAMN06265371_108209 [Lutibacter agarilyticus]
MKKIILILVLFLSATSVQSQCSFLKTVIRPDNNEIKYFNPKPVIRQAEYEVGIAIYKNITSNEFMLNISVLFKTMTSQKLTNKVIIQTTNNKGIELIPLKSESMVMNQRDIAIGLYKIEQVDLEELNRYPLKSLFFYLEDNLKGSTITENNSILITELNCF